MERRGLILGIPGSRGRMGYGEASPLAGLHDADLRQTAEELAGYLSTGSMDGLSGISKCAVEMALEDGRGGEVEVNALLGPDEGAGSTGADGVATVKIKVGRLSLSEDIARTRRLRSKLGPSVRFRLDANRAWTVEQALRFHEEIADPALDYLEEPLRDPGELGRLGGIPIALDESLAADPCLIGLPGLAAAILKPTVSGGISEARRLMKEAEARGIQAVVSSTFETSIGIAGLGRLALEAPGTVHGLGTAAWLAEDLLGEPLSPSGGRIRVPAAGDLEGMLVRGRLRLERQG